MNISNGCFNITFPLAPQILNPPHSNSNYSIFMTIYYQKSRNRDKMIVKHDKTNVQV